MRTALGHVLTGSDYRVLAAPGGREALTMCEQEKPAAILLDLMMPDMSGMEVIERLRPICEDVPVIVISGHADIPTAVAAMKLGAYDFIVKPPDIERLLVVLQHAIEKSELAKELKRLNAAAVTSLEWLLGRSVRMKKIVQQIQQVARTDFTVILEGETGVGKSFVSGIIHSLSGRASGPFVRVDMASIPESLVESELFGHEKGAFTGAVTDRKGFFEQSRGGTLFLDELENMSDFVQTKFLSVLEERTIRHVGGSSEIDIDVRIITATNRDIKQALAEKKFRKDLYYRISEFVITIPPLRERSDDIPFLAQKFLAEACADLQRPSMSLGEDTFVFLMQYPWPGNVRELRNVIRRAVLMAEDTVIHQADVQYLIDDISVSDDVDSPSTLLPLKELSALAVRDVEKKAVQRALAMTRGNKTKAASMLQVDFKTLQTKIREYDIQ